MGKVSVKHMYTSLGGELIMTATIKNPRTFPKVGLPSWRFLKMPTLPPQIVPTLLRSPHTGDTRNVLIRTRSRSKGYKLR